MEKVEKFMLSLSCECHAVPPPSNSKTLECHKLLCLVSLPLPSPGASPPECDEEMLSPGEDCDLINEGADHDTVQSSESTGRLGSHCTFPLETTRKLHEWVCRNLEVRADSG